MNIGQSVKKLRKERDLRQGQLAESIGITQTYLSQIESGKKTANTSVLVKISEYFEIPLPIIFWFAIEEKDVAKSKQAAFRTLKPTIDQMITSII